MTFKKGQQKTQQLWVLSIKPRMVNCQPCFYLLSNCWSQLFLWDLHYTGCGKLPCGLTALGNRPPTSPRLVHRPTIPRNNCNKTSRMSGPSVGLAAASAALGGSDLWNAQTHPCCCSAGTAKVVAITFVKLPLIKSLSGRVKHGGEKLSKGVIKKREKWVLSIKRK